MKKYNAPELEIMEFELEDILTVSMPGGNLSDGSGDTGWY